MPTQTSKPQSIEELRKRYEELNRKKITAEADHKNAQKQLDELKTAAKAQWDTDDLEELRAKLKKMEDEERSVTRPWELWKKKALGR